AEFTFRASSKEKRTQRDASSLLTSAGRMRLTSQGKFASTAISGSAPRRSGHIVTLRSSLSAAPLRCVLLATDREGYGNLCELITRGRRQAKKGEYNLLLSDLEQGLCGCLALWLPPAQPDLEQARWLSERFRNRAWIAVELLCGHDDSTRLAELQEISRRSGLPLVAAGDVHMHVRQRRALQDTLTAIRLKCTVAQAGRALFPNGERHLRRLERLARLYPPELLIETLNVAERCTFSLDTLRYEYPEELVPAGETPASHLRKLTEAGFQWRFGQQLSGNRDQESDDKSQKATGADVELHAS